MEQDEQDYKEYKETLELLKTTAPGEMIDGDPAAPVLVVAMAPGREELQNKKPLIGSSGKLLWSQLSKKAGIDRADCFIINTIGEWPEGNDGNPTAAQFAKWWDTFDEAVRASQAKVALLLGGAALWRFTGLTGIEDWRGYIIEQGDCRALKHTATIMGEYKTTKKGKYQKGDPRPIKQSVVSTNYWPKNLEVSIATFHPAAILRTGLSTLPVFSADIARLGRALRGELTLSDPQWSEHAPPIPRVAPAYPRTFDIETGGINNDIITRIGCSGAPDDCWTALWDEAARSSLKRTLGGGPSVAFNIAFDAPRLEAHGVEVPEPWFCAMLAAGLAKPDLKKSLNFVTSLYTDSRRWKHLSDSEPAKYNALDVCKTRELYHVLREELARSGQLDLFQKRMMPALPTIVRMTSRGIKVDQEWKERWIESLTVKLNVNMGLWEEIAPGVKTAGKGLLNFMHKDLDLPVQYSKHGGFTSDAASIRKMLLQNKLSDHARNALQVLLELRGVQKELRTYAEIEVGGDGCIHPGYLPAGKDTDSYGKGAAGTGRLAASNPNIQNQPQSARRMYIPHFADYILVERDYSQEEARILAELADDDVLRQAIAEGLHDSNQKALGVDKTRAKNGFYGWAYGAGKRTLHNTFAAHGYNVPEKECAQLLRSFDERFYKCRAWRAKISAELSSCYYLTNAFGRRRYFMGGGRDTPAGLDFHPQSCSADIMWGILRELESRLREVNAFLLAPVHDSILIECPRSSAARDSSIMKEVMEQPWKELNNLVIPTEAKIGNNWGSMIAEDSSSPLLLAA